MAKYFLIIKNHLQSHPGEEYNCRCYAEDIHATFDGDEEKVSKHDIKSWPIVPIDGKLTEGLPTKRRYRLRGEKSLYDIYGGEWRPHIIDQRHNLHWDYKPAGKCTEWLNIPINGKEPKIMEKCKYLKFMEKKMLHVRCFDNFDGKYPQILIHGNAEDYLLASEYLANKKSALLTDKEGFLYFPPLDYCKDEWLVINEEECADLSQLFAKIAKDPGCYHYYYELKSQENASFDMKISIGEYDKEMFYEGLR